MLDYLRFGGDPKTAEEDGWYLHSGARMLARFSEWGLITLAKNGAIHFSDDVTAFDRATVIAVKEFDALRAGHALRAYVTAEQPVGYEGLRQRVLAAAPKF